MASWHEVGAALTGLGASWALAGATAANAYRETPRATGDVDILTNRTTGLRATLERTGWVVREHRDDSEPFLVRARKGEIIVDVLLAETEYQSEALARSKEGVLGAEDVIVHKLIAGRPSDLDDIRSILAAGVLIDIAYVERWAGEWGVSELWSELRSQKDT